MASVFGFRARNAARDSETDSARLARMAGLLEQIAAEIDAERSGLHARYKRQVTDAAFLDEAIENREAASRQSERAEALSSSIMRCEQRLAELARQAAFMHELRQHLGRFPAVEAAPAAGARLRARGA